MSNGDIVYRYIDGDSVVEVSKRKGQGESMTTAQYEDIIARLARIEALLTTRQPVAAGAQAIAPQAVNAPPKVATDDDLDGEWGNPEIRRDPPRWNGDSRVGQRMSDCPPAYLAELASFKEWAAAKDDESGAVDSKGRPRSYWARQDAARARGWMARAQAAAPRGEVRTSSAAARERAKAAPPVRVQVAAAPAVEDDDNVPF